MLLTIFSFGFRGESKNHFIWCFHSRGWCSCTDFNHLIFNLDRMASANGMTIYKMRTVCYLEQKYWIVSSRICSTQIHGIRYQSHQSGILIEISFLTEFVAISSNNNNNKECRSTNSKRNLRLPCAECDCPHNAHTVNGMHKHNIFISWFIIIIESFLRHVFSLICILNDKRFLCMCVRCMLRNRYEWRRQRIGTE